MTHLWRSQAEIAASSQAPVMQRFPPLPPIDPLLVRGLFLRYPDAAPELSWTREQMLVHAAQVSVVRFLERELRLQQQNPYP